MVKIIIYGIFVIFLANYVLGVGNCGADVGDECWVDDPANCPQEYQSVTCNPNYVCGYSGGTFCYDTSSFEWNNQTSDTTGTTSVTGEYDGGGVIDCYDYDGAEPHCDGSADYWCDRNANCWSTEYRITNCTGFGSFECGHCRSGYGDCDAGGDSCEVEFGVTDYPTGINNHYDDCNTCGCDSNYEVCAGGNCATNPSCNYHYNVACAANAQNASGCAGCECTGAYLDCDDDDGDADTGTSRAGTNGCEVDSSGSCTVSGLQGSYNGDCTCDIDPQDIATTGLPVNWSGDNPMLWFNFYSDSDTIWINHSTGYIFVVNGSGVYYNNTDISIDTDTDTNTNCSAQGICSDVCYMDYYNSGQLIVEELNTTTIWSPFGLDFYPNGSTTDYFRFETDTSGRPLIRREGGSTAFFEATSENFVCWSFRELQNERGTLCWYKNDDKFVIDATGGDIEMQRNTNITHNLSVEVIKDYDGNVILCKNSSGVWFNGDC